MNLCLSKLEGSLSNIWLNCANPPRDNNIKIIIKLLSKILNHPNEKKYLDMSFKLISKRFKKQIKYFINLLNIIGFKLYNRNNTQRLILDNDDLDKIQIVYNKIINYINKDMDKAVNYLIKKGFGKNKSINAIITAKYNVIIAEKYLQLNKIIPDMNQSNRVQYTSLLPVKCLTNMGYSNSDSINALLIAKGDINVAIDIIQSCVTQTACYASVMNCNHVSRLIQILKRYHRINKLIFDNNNIRYLLNDFNHILFNHNNDTHFKYINNKFDNCDITKCEMMKRLHRDRDIRNSLVNTDQKTNIDTSKMSSYFDICDKVHCHFLHSYDQKYRLIDDDNKIMNIDKTNKVNKNKPNKFQIQNYSFSQPFYYWKYFQNSNEMVMNTTNAGYKYKHWYIAPKYKSFKDELLNNEIATICVQQFDTEYDKATQYNQLHYSKTLVAKSIGVGNATPKNWNHVCVSIKAKEFDISSYGITEGTQIQVHHLMSIIFYCGYSSLSFKFSKTFRRIQPQNINKTHCMQTDVLEFVKQSPDIQKENDLSLKRRHSNFHYFAKYLTESVNVYSKDAMFGNISTFYHGISQEMIFTRMHFETYQPFSTTNSWEVARNFCNNSGMILEMSCSRKIRYFDCGWISDFSNEGELLFVRNFGRLKFENITNISSKMDFREYINALSIIDSFSTSEPAFNNDVVQKHSKACMSSNHTDISHNPIMYGGKPIKPFLKLLIFKLFKHELNRYIPHEYPKMQNIHPYIQQLLHQMCTKKQGVVMDANLFDIEIYNQFEGTECYQGYSFLKSLFFDNAYEMIKLDVISLLFPNAFGIVLRQKTALKSTQIEYILHCIPIITKSKCSIIEIVVENIKHNVSMNTIISYQMKFSQINWNLMGVKWGSNTLIIAISSTALQEFNSKISRFDISPFSYNITNLM